MAEIGASGVDLRNSIHLPDWPDPSVGELRRIRGMVRRQGLEISGCGSYTDAAIKTGARLTHQEMVDQLTRDLRHTHELESPVMRLAPITPLNVALDCLKLAESLGVKLGVEVHAPFAIDHMQEGGLDLERLRGIESSHYGLIPDMGAFAHRIPPRVVDFVVEKMGAPRELVDRLVGHLEAGVSLAWLEQHGPDEGLLPVFNDLAELLEHMVGFQKPADLMACMPYAVNCHGKFYAIDSRGEEPAFRHNG